MEFFLFCAFSCFLWPPSIAVNCLNQEPGHRSHGSKRDIWNLCFVCGLQIEASVEAWAELHQEELIADWERLQGGEASLPIVPLE